MLLWKRREVDGRGGIRGGWKEERVEVDEKEKE